MDRNELIREIQERYREAGRSFNELQRRQWAARAAVEIGRGGIAVVSKALRMSPNTIKRGMLEITSEQAHSSTAGARIRKSGGGRKPRGTLSVGTIEKSPTTDSADTTLDRGAADVSEQQRQSRQFEAG